MLKAAFITRASLFSVPGGDTVQVTQTAKWLQKLGVEADIKLAGSALDYRAYDLFHFFNLNRPADIIAHLGKIRKPLFVSPILVDYSEYDRYYRKGLPGMIMKKFSQPANEYIKTMSRWLKGNDRLPARSYIWSGHTESIRKILQRTTVLLPNAESEKKELYKKFNVNIPARIVPNGIDHTIFTSVGEVRRKDDMVLCVARIEGIKNQYNLIQAINGTRFNLYCIGSYAPNQLSYYKACRELAGSNIIFRERMPQEELVQYYQQAKVHVLPSWFETCGLSSLEAAAMGANIVVSPKGFTRDYFGDEAFYCDPGHPLSIRNAIEEAAAADQKSELQERIYKYYTWERAAVETFKAYESFV
jgi:glycosyltransferase involved in cell wall biosynthesis